MLFGNSPGAGDERIVVIHFQETTANIFDDQHHHVTEQSRTACFVHQMYSQGAEGERLDKKSQKMLLLHEQN